MLLVVRVVVVVMIKIIEGKKILTYTEEEFGIIKKLIKIALEFEHESYELFQDMALYNDLENIKAAMQEVIGNDEEIDLIIRLNKDEDLVNKIKQIYE